MRTHFSLTQLVRTVAAASVLFSLNAAAQAPAPADPAILDKGRYLAIAGDCMACHSVPKTGKPFAGGYAISSPLGNIYSSNITPSRTAGIGNYTEEQFSAALRKGIRADGAHLYPAMPYTAYALMTDEDVHAMYVYFMQGVKPVDDAVPETKLPFPFNIRASMIVWNKLFLNKHPDAATTPNAATDQRLARGAYLTNALAHCSACHTPRNFLMAEQADKGFAGASLGSWYAPNITSDKISGVGAWSDAELTQYLRTGRAEGKNQAAGPMAEAVENSLQYLHDDDIAAMVAYLRTVPPIRDAQDNKPDSKATFVYGQSASDEAALRGMNRQNEHDSLKTGAALYSGNCAACHQMTGAGSQDQAFPSLFHNTATGGGNAGMADNLVSTILFGVDRTVGDKRSFMPRFGAGSVVNPLTDEQIATISNYVLAQYGNPELHVTAKQVAQARDGGPRPFLARVQPFIAPLMIVVLVLLLLWWLVAALNRRKRRNHKDFV